MQIGNAPCSWGVEFADDERNPKWQDVLRECASAGFEGIDLGPVGYFPEDREIFGEALRKNNLKLASGVVFRPFHNPEDDEYIEATKRTCKTLVAHGGEQLTIIDAIAKERTRTLGRPDAAPKLDETQWKKFLERIKTSAKISKEEYGITPSIHPHAGGYCDFEEEVKRVLNETDITLCIDTAHLTLAGMDAIEVTKKYKERISHVHLKDIDEQKKKKVKKENEEFYQACAEGLFCELGKGEINFKEFKNLLEEIGYKGWCITEQDCAPDAKASKIETAKANRDYLRSVGY